jgi:hypothetical protein
MEATVDVAAWLKNLGLEQYEAVFRDNAIDGDLLPSLTAEDLRDLGVTIVGHRRKLLDAIVALGAASKPALSPAAAEPPATLSAPAVVPNLSRVRAATRSDARLPSCSAISSARRASPPSSMPRIGAVSSTPISTRRRRL